MFVISGRFFLNYPETNFEAYHIHKIKTKIKVLCKRLFMFIYKKTYTLDCEPNPLFPSVKNKNEPVSTHILHYF